MQGNFTYYNPTKLYFGEESLNKLKGELANFGQTVLLNYGSGSVKRNGIYDQVVAILRNWMQEIGLPLTISEIGATPDMIDNIVSTTVLFPAGYLDLTAEDIREILKESL